MSKEQLTVLGQYKLSFKERIRASELGYTQQDIKDLGLVKIREIIQSGTVKEGHTDRAIQRQEAKDLKIKNQATKTKDANQAHVTNWLAKLKKKGINISEATLREAVNSGDAVKYLGSKGISHGHGSTSVPWGVLKSVENIINYENKYESKPETTKKTDNKPDIQNDPNTLSIIHGISNNKSIQEQQEINNVNKKVDSQNAINNNSLKIVQ